MKFTDMQEKGFRGINIEAALKVLILMGFSLFFFSLVHSGDVQLYVHPRMVPFIKFGILAMGLISMFSLKELFKPRSKFKIVPYLLFLIPLSLAFFIPATPMDPSAMSFGDIKLNRQIATDTSSVNTGAGGIEEKSSDTAPKMEVTSANFAALAALANKPDDRSLKLRNNMIVPNDTNFYRWLNELYANMGTYQGKKIQVTGFVFKDKTTKDNEFVPARMMMTCCTADLQVVGMLCRYDKAKALKKDAWVKVAGTIEVIDFKGEKIPIIVVDNVEVTEKPKNDYVYPF